MDNKLKKKLTFAVRTPRIAQTAEYFAKAIEGEELRHVIPLLEGATYDLFKGHGIDTKDNDLVEQVEYEFYCHVSRLWAKSFLVVLGERK